MQKGFKKRRKSLCLKFLWNLLTYKKVNKMQNVLEGLKQLSAMGNSWRELQESNKL